MLSNLISCKIEFVRKSCKSNFQGFCRDCYDKIIDILNDSKEAIKARKIFLKTRIREFLSEHGEDISYFVKKSGAGMLIMPENEIRQHLGLHNRQRTDVRSISRELRHVGWDSFFEPEKIDFEVEASNFIFFEAGVNKYKLIEHLKKHGRIPD